MKKMVLAATVLASMLVALCAGTAKAEKGGGSVSGSGDKMSVEFENYNVSEALTLMARNHGMNLVIGSDAKNKFRHVKLDDVPTSQAVDAIVSAGRAHWKMVGNTYIVRAEEFPEPEADDVPVQNDTQQAGFDIEFAEGTVVNLLSSIAQLNDSDIIVDAKVAQKLSLVVLRNETMESALDKISAACDLTWKKSEDGTYLVANAPTAEAPAE